MCLHEVKAGCCLKLRSGFEMSDKRNYLLSLWSPSPQSKCFYLPRASKQNCNISISLWEKIIWLLLAFIPGTAAWLSMTKLFLGSAGVKLHNGSSTCYAVALTFSKTLMPRSRRRHEISSQDCSPKSTRKPEEPRHCSFPYAAIMLTIKQALTVVSEISDRERRPSCPWELN